MRSPDKLPVIQCGRGNQHPGHAYRVSDDPDNLPDEFWCRGLNGDGTSPYDPQRPGYVPLPQAPSARAALDDLDDIALMVKGHLSLHCSYGPEAARHPAPDWTCQLLYTAGDPPAPVAWFGTGASLPEACQDVLSKIEQAVEDAGYQDPPNEDTP